MLILTIRGNVDSYGMCDCVLLSPFLNFYIFVFFFLILLL